ncbi:cysteine-rich RLK (RECEPTOR-like protein kinase) 8 [Abeliophyllum distichum]|uniref:Cysteine-rich RLK (RECEPTOR-like protein kinase) 8 n=1 Tax=Abeliophyllum distichum TaxID=126358 RepID=A0ABD1QJT8_9LAMI
MNQMCGKWKKFLMLMMWGSVMYTMVRTRLDIVHATSTLSMFMTSHGPEHWKALKWLLRYLKATSNLGLIFVTCNERVILKGFVDADFAGDNDIRKSTSAYVFILCGTCISWKPHLQPIVALSTTESEYIAANEVIKEELFLGGNDETGLRGPTPLLDNSRVNSEPVTVWALIGSKVICLKLNSIKVVF